MPPDAARVPGDLVQSLTYRESYAPPVAEPAAVAWPRERRRTDDAPRALRSAVAVAWALLHLVAALALVAVVLLVLARVAGAMT